MSPAVYVITGGTRGIGAAVARGTDPHEAAATINRLAVGWADQPQ